MEISWTFQLKGGQDAPFFLHSKQLSASLNVEDLEWRLKGQVMASGKKSRSRLCDQKRDRRHVGSCLFQSQFPSANKSAKSYRMLQTNFQQSSIGRTIFCASKARSLHLLRCGLHQIRCLWCLVMAGATCVWW